MKEVTLVVPGPLATRTGGSIYDRRIAECLRARGWAVPVVELPAFVHPLAPPLEATRGRLAGIPDGSVVLIDGLAFGTMPEVIEGEAWRLRFVPIIHMLLSTTPGLTPGEAGWLSSLERRALHHARHIVVTGLHTVPSVRAMLGRYDDSGVTRVQPGAAAGHIASRRRTQGNAVRLLCVANVTRGKGHDVLLQSLASVTAGEWTLQCAGSVERDRAFAQRMRSLTDDLGLSSRVQWLGELEDVALTREYESADLFVLATRGETYGMAVAEAIAHGVPVVSTRTGEISTIAGDGGVLVDCGDGEGLTVALHRVLCDRALRETLAAGARRAALLLPTWEAAAATIEGVLMKVQADG